jgi:hypothetical protein
MRRAFKPYSFVGWALLAWLVAPSANGAVHYIGRLDEPLEVFTADKPGSADYVTEALPKLESDGTISVTKMTPLPEMSTWGMMLLWFIGVGLALVPWSRKRSVSALE